MNKIIYFLLLSIIAIFLISPLVCMEGFVEGLIIWGQKIVPALFPFFFISRILTELGFATIISKPFSKITSKLYNTSGVSGYVYIMSILTGYPMGSKLTSDLYLNNTIDKGQATRIISFTSTSGPLFIIGTVGIGFLNNYKFGIIILICHYVGALINGLIYRNYNLNKDTNVYSTKIDLIDKLNTPNNILEDAMLSSIKNIFIIGGYVCLFFMLINAINHFNLLLPLNNLFAFLNNKLNLPFQLPGEFINGIIEITKGSYNISKLIFNYKIMIPLITALISFGGLSIIMQSYIYIKKIGISFSLYLLQKTTQMIISLIISIIVCYLIL